MIVRCLANFDPHPDDAEKGETKVTASTFDREGRMSVDYERQLSEAPVAPEKKGGWFQRRGNKAAKQRASVASAAGGGGAGRAMPKQASTASVNAGLRGSATSLGMSGQAEEVDAPVKGLLFELELPEFEELLCVAGTLILLQMQLF